MSTNNIESVTGRDGYIVAKALRWALKYAESRPNSEREWSDEADIKLLLKTTYEFPNAYIDAVEKAVEDYIANMEKGERKLEAEDLAAATQPQSRAPVQ